MGTVWRREELVGTVWRREELVGTVWRREELVGTVWRRDEMRRLGVWTLYGDRKRRGDCEHYMGWGGDEETVNRLWTLLVDMRRL